MDSVSRIICWNTTDRQTLLSEFIIIDNELQFSLVVLYLQDITKFSRVITS